MPDDVKNTTEVPEWTKSEYLETNVPYKWLYQFSDNPLKMQQMVERVTVSAKEAGVAAFKSLWANYLKSVRQSTSEPMRSITDFTDQPLALKCGDYVCNDAAITVFGAYGIDLVCSHPIMPVRRLVNIDTGEVKMEIAFRRGNIWRTAIFEKQIISSSQKILALASYGIGVDSENAKLLVSYLSAMENLNYDELPEVKSVARLGWMHGYGFSPYVENLVYDGREEMKHIFKCVREEGSYEKWLALAKSVRSGGSIPARILLAASFASAIVKPLDSLPFIVHAWGSVSGLGKTVGLYLAASVWGSPVLGDYCQSYNATAVGQEWLAAFCGNMPLCIDELQCIKEKGKTHSNFDAMIYMLCEGIGRLRGTRGGGIQQTPTWRNCTLSTGETPITGANSAAGAVNRVIDMDCSDSPLFENPRETVAILTRNFGHAGKRFVAQLSNQAAVETMREIHQAFLDQIIGKATDKQALSASIILTADAIADLFIFDDGNSLKIQDILPYLTTNEQADTNGRAYELIVDTVSLNPNKFNNSAYGDSYQGECWGKIDNNEYAYIIKNQFDRIMLEAGFSSESFLSWAVRKKMLRHEKGRTTIVSRLPGVKIPARCVAIRLPNGDGTAMPYESPVVKEQQEELPFSEPGDADDSAHWDASVEFAPEQLEQQKLEEPKAEEPTEKTVDQLPF